MKNNAFTLTEILVVIAIVGILGAAVLPEIGKTIDKARAAKIYKLTETLEGPCAAYFSDTGKYAFEKAVGGFWWCDDCNRLTVRNISDPEWNGPYLKRPLLSSDNPFAGPGANTIMVNDNLSWAGGFDLDGDGVIDRDGSGNSLILYDTTGANKFMLNSRRAKIINDIFDTGVPGAWEDTGKVRYNNSSSPAVIYIYLLGGDIR